MVDDHTLFRQALCDLLRTDEQFEVVGDARNAAEAIAVCERTRPDILLLDANLPDASAGAVIDRIRICSPTSRPIVVSMFDNPDLVADLVARGARGYLLKTATREELITAMRTVHTDDERIVLSVSPSTLTAPAPAPPPSPLTDRETEVLTLVAAALSNRQIATRLGLTEGTVKRHLSNIFGKLGATSRMDAVNRAAPQLVRKPAGRA
ncbi:two-component system response regulator [Actinoplanes sp. N902-109]|nr:two-component system response regulator [Actinoplanes sp. N902-109]